MAITKAFAEAIFSFLCSFLVNILAEMMAFKYNMFISQKLFLCNVLDIFINNFTEIYIFTSSHFTAQAAIFLRHIFENITNSIRNTQESEYSKFHVANKLSKNYVRVYDFIYALQLSHYQRRIQELNHI